MIIVQNDIGNKHSPIVQVVPLTTYKEHKSNLPSHVIIEPTNYNGLKNKSIALVEQIQTIPMNCLCDKIGRIEDFYEEQICLAIALQLGLLNALIRTQLKCAGSMVA